MNDLLDAGSARAHPGSRRHASTPSRCPWAFRARRVRKRAVVVKRHVEPTETAVALAFRTRASTRSGDACSAPPSSRRYRTSTAHELRPSLRARHEQLDVRHRQLVAALARRAGPQVNDLPPLNDCAAVGRARGLTAGGGKDADAVRPRLVVAQRVRVEREPRDQLRDRGADPPRGQGLGLGSSVCHGWWSFPESEATPPNAPAVRVPASRRLAGIGVGVPQWSPRASTAS